MRRKICKAVLGILTAVMLFGMSVSAEEIVVSISSMNGVMYALEGTDLYPYASAEWEPLVTDIRTGMPLMVNGYTDNGFYRVILDSREYYVPCALLTDDSSIATPNPVPTGPVSTSKTYQAEKIKYPYENQYYWKIYIPDEDILWPGNILPGSKQYNSHGRIYMSADVEKVDTTSKHVPYSALADTPTNLLTADLFAQEVAKTAYIVPNPDGTIPIKDANGHYLCKVEESDYNTMLMIAGEQFGFSSTLRKDYTDNGFYIAFRNAVEQLVAQDVPEISVSWYGLTKYGSVEILQNVLLDVYKAHHKYPDVSFGLSGRTADEEVSYGDWGGVLLKGNIRGEYYVCLFNSDKSRLQRNEESAAELEAALATRQ